MTSDHMMPHTPNMEHALRLLPDRRNVRFHLPPLPLAGQEEPLRLFLDFDTASVDQLIDRLLVLRAQMLPSPSERRRPS